MECIPFIASPVCYSLPLCLAEYILFHQHPIFTQPPANIYLP
jgi:hypothetical protein